MTPTRFRLDEGFEYGDAATTSRKSLAARRAVDWRNATLYVKRSAKGRRSCTTQLATLCVPGGATRTIAVPAR